MSRGQTRRVLTKHLGSSGSRQLQDQLIVEEPLSVRLDGELVATTMRTPGDDFELAVGLLATEGMLEEAAIRFIRYCGSSSAMAQEFNEVNVDTGGTAGSPNPRLGPASSSCGICGVQAIEKLCDRLNRLDTEPFEGETLLGLADRMVGRQELFSVTGAVHAAAAFNRSGEPILLREDIGRHNAVDKIIGRLHLDGSLPASDLGLWVSGRASFEMVQKAWAGGFGVLVAVSAPSALAVDTAEAAGIQLAGFARGENLNFYTSF